MADFDQHCQDPKLMNGSLQQNLGEHTIDPHSGYDCGVISYDPRCRGHSREQALAGMLAHQHGLLPFTFPPLYLQGLPPDQPPAPEAVIQACGM